MMAAFVNTLFLYTTMIYMIYESINRFFNPEVIEPIYMIIVGLIAVIANGISAYVLKNWKFLLVLLMTMDMSIPTMMAMQI